jgi:alpha-mannosidase
LADTELLHVDLDSMLPEKQPQLDTAWDGMRQALRLLRDDLADAVSSRIPSQPAEGRGLLLLNTLPFARTHEVQWPAAWRRPAAEAAVEAAQEATGNSPTSQASGERLLVKLPPGGFVWLHEADPGRPTQTLTTAARREPPLAENLKLRNRHFEVTLSERTGGVASVLYHGQRGNRLSQQSGYRYEREITLPDDGSGEIRKVSYAVPELLQHKVLEAGTVFAALETTTEFHSPQDGKTLGRVVQVTRVDRVRPRLEIVLTVQDAVTAPVKGNPWLAGWCCRFAWEQESALVHRSVLGQSAGFRLERIESSEYVEAEDGTRRMVIASDGRPWHRRAGSRMLDSLLVCEGETERTFRFWIDFDQPHPLRTAEEMLTPVVTHTVEGRVPVGTSSAWILGLSARNVQLVRSDYQPRRPVESDVLSLILSETDGLGGDCLIRTARKPTAAYEMHPGRQARSTLALSPEGVVVAFSPWQLKEIQLIF